MKKIIQNLDNSRFLSEKRSKLPAKFREVLQLCELNNKIAVILSDFWMKTIKEFPRPS